MSNLPKYHEKNNNSSILQQENVKETAMLKQKVADLELENIALKEQGLTLEERVEHLEELSKIKTLRTCHELAQHGVTTSGWYNLDPDGDLIGNQMRNECHSYIEHCPINLKVNHQWKCTVTFKLGRPSFTITPKRLLSLIIAMMSDALSMKSSIRLQWTKSLLCLKFLSIANSPLILVASVLSSLMMLR